MSGKKYSDLSSMGVGTNILGYANDKIDREVIKSIKLSNLSSLNSFEEVLLAEKLIELHPWAEMVKFARTGAEANSIAIRLQITQIKKRLLYVILMAHRYLSASIRDEKNFSKNDGKCYNLECSSIKKYTHTFNI